jgi:hypothetical protein
MDFCATNGGGAGSGTFGNGSPGADGSVVTNLVINGISYTLPSADGNGGDALITDGDGGLSFAPVSGIGDGDKGDIIVSGGGSTWTIAAGAVSQAEISGLTTSDAPRFAGLNIGDASDTTIERVSAGVISVEGATVLLSGGALGTPASGTLSNCTGLPLTGLTTLPAYVLFRNETDVAVTSGETTILSQSIAGGALGSYGAIDVEIPCTIANNAGSRQYTLRIKFGGTTLYDGLSASLAANANTRAAKIRFRLRNESASSQTVDGTFSASTSASPTTGYGGTLDDAFSSTFLGTGSVNTTTSQTLEVTITPSGTGATFTTLNSMGVLLKP